MISRGTCVGFDGSVAGFGGCLKVEGRLHANVSEGWRDSRYFEPL